MKTERIIISNPYKSSVLNFWQWALFFFVVSSMTFSYISGLSKITVLYGVVLAFLFSIFFLYNGLKLQPEVIIYFIWVLWALGGLSNAVDKDLYMTGLRTIFQMSIMLFVVAGITALLRNMSMTMAAIIVSGLIVIAQTLVTGEFQQVSEAGSARIEGLTENANSFAYQLLFVIIAGFYFLKRKPSLSWRAFFAAIIVISLFGIIYSGSRKALLGALAFVFLWWIFCQGKKLSKHPIKAYAILLILLGVFYYFTVNVMSETYIWKRLQAAGTGADEKRVELYKDGFDMIKSNPVFGVGLDNFRRLSSSGLYSHCDYIEVAANTGIIGFTIYFSIYIFIWRRLNYIKARINNLQILYTIGLLKASILTILFLALGRPNINSKITWIFLASAIGYSWAIEHIWMKLTVIRREYLERMRDA